MENITVSIEGTFAYKIYKQAGDFNINAYHVDKKFIPEEYQIKGKRGYTIAVKGNVLPIDKSLKVVFTGKWTTYKQSLTFDCEYFTIKEANTNTGIVNYFSSSLFPGIGKATAQKLADTYGKNIYELLDSNPEQITCIPLKKVELIVKNYNQTRVLASLYKEFGDLKINRKALKDIADQYGDSAIETINQNPYILLSISNIGFTTCDEIAIKKNPSALTNPLRIKSGIIYVLRQDLEISKNLYMPEEELLSKTYKLLNNNLTEEVVSKDMIINRLNSLTKYLTEVVKDDNDYYLRFMYEKELYIGHLLSKRAKKMESKETCLKINNLLSSALTNLSDSQLKAVSQSLSHNLSIITGGPGTGKTTTLKQIIRLYRQVFGESITLLAPTGKAARRMEQATGCPASTIHSRLRIFSGDINPIYEGLVIVDEFSMVDIDLMYSLIDNIGDDCKVIFVGDIHQLPSVGAGCVLKDMINSNCICVSELTENFRQKKGDIIISNAEKTKSGDDNFEYGKTFCYLKSDTDKEAFEKIKKTYARAINHFGVKNVAVMSPLRQSKDRYLSVTEELNPVLREIANPDSTVSYKVTNTEFFVGDRVIQTVNNAQSSNGDIGTITNITFDSEIAYFEIAWDDRETEPQTLTTDDMNDIRHAYSMSIHKAQGSEIGCVIIPMVKEQICPIFKRNLLYTAITRATDTCVIIGNQTAISKCVAEEDTTSRRTKLASRIANPKL